MSSPGPIGRARALGGNLAALVRRRRESRKPRVRVRVAHGETRLLAESNPACERMLALSSDLVAEYGKGSRAGA